MDPVTSQPPVSEADARLNAGIKSIERRLLLRSMLPLIALGVTGAIGYVLIASSTGVSEFWIGPPLMLAGSVVGFVGFRRRLAELRTYDAPNTRHFPWLFLAWCLLAAGLLIPPYTAG